MSVKMFIIFHRYLSHELLEHYKSVDLTFFGVNEDVEKRITKEFQNRVIYEYRLSRYESLFQKFGFGESSCIMHVGNNDLHQDFEYIGFTQYDMLLNLDKLSRQLKPNACIYTRLTKKNMFKQSHLDRIPIEFFFECYNEYFGTKYTQEDFKRLSSNKLKEVTNIFLCTFIIHKDVYNKLYPFWTRYMYKLFQHLYIENGFENIKTKTHIHNNYRFCSWVMEITLGITLILENSLTEYICIKSIENNRKNINYDYDTERDYQKLYSKELIKQFENKSVLLS